MKFNFLILKNETTEDHLDWINACKKSEYDITYKVIDITLNDWLEQILRENSDCILCRPPGLTSYFKQLFDERLYILHHILGKKIYPTYEEILVYENKKFLSYWLQANDIPHPKTWVFYHKEEAIEFARKCDMPIVAKTAIGASASGVKIFRNRKDSFSYINLAFSNKGIGRRFGPNLRKVGLKKRIIKRLKNIPEYLSILGDRYAAVGSDRQKWFVIFQKYYKLDYEWRAVKIGDSYFAHKKLATKGEIMSGTSNVSWDGPSQELLEFMKFVCDKRGFYSQAIDIFEPEEGKFLVNELQCFFGSKNPHQMILKGKPGRYFYDGSKWIFEKGAFNQHNSFDLRLAHVIDMVKTKK